VAAASTAVAAASTAVAAASTAVAAASTATTFGRCIKRRTGDDDRHGGQDDH
jgi:Spy/CpxP family protein refolding chaperone